MNELILLNFLMLLSVVSGYYGRELRGVQANKQH